MNSRNLHMTTYNYISNTHFIDCNWYLVLSNHDSILAVIIHNDSVTLSRNSSDLGVTTDYEAVTKHSKYRLNIGNKKNLI